MGSIHLPVIVAIVIAYVAGSIPSAYIAGKWRGVDLRKHGSGNLGATNVVRGQQARPQAVPLDFHADADPDEPRDPEEEREGVESYRPASRALESVHH